jgi:hypothetical protein
MKGRDNEQNQKVALILALKELVDSNADLFNGKTVPKIYFTILSKKAKDPDLILESLKGMVNELPQGKVRHAFKEIKLTKDERRMNSFIKEVLDMVGSKSIDDVVKYTLAINEGLADERLMRQGEAERQQKLAASTPQKK